MRYWHWSFVLFSCVLSLPSYAERLQIDIPERAGILVSIRSGQVLWQKRCDEPYPPASITKVANALFIVTHWPDRLDDMVTITPEVLASGSSRERLRKPWLLCPSGTTMGLKVGETVSVRSLLEGMLIPSANDAANALGFYFGEGSPENYLRALNRYLKQLGCNQTNFVGLCGFDHPNHYASARDLAKMGRCLLEHPILAQIVKLPHFHRPESNKSTPCLLSTTNGMLLPGQKYYPHCTGIKTGFTNRAGSCLLAAANNGQRHLIAVVLGAKSADARIASIKKLFEAAFNEPRIEHSWLPAEFIAGELHIKGAQRLLKAKLHTPLSIVDYASEIPEVKLQVRWLKPLKLPIAIDQVVGVVEAVDHHGAVIASASLLAAEAVAATWGYRLSHIWKHWGLAGDLIAIGSLVCMLLMWSWALSRRYEPSHN